MQLYKQQETLCKELRDKSGLSNSFQGQANIFYSWSRLEEAMQLYKQQETLCKELGYKLGLSRSFEGQANIFYSWGRLEEAMKVHKQGEALCKELGDKIGLARSLRNQSVLLSDKMNRPKEALILAEEAYKIATEHNFNELVKQIKQILENIKKKVNGNKS